jgi:hypothetical protein
MQVRKDPTQALVRVAHIDRERMVIHIRKSKDRKDRDVLLCPGPLETLREYRLSPGQPRDDGDHLTD